MAEKQAEFNPDPVPASQQKKIDADENEQEKEPIVYEEHPWKYYFQPANATKLMTKRWTKFAAWGGVFYTIQFVLMMSATNFYSDPQRVLLCEPGYAAIKPDFNPGLAAMNAD